MTSLTWSDLAGREFMFTGVFSLESVQFSWAALLKQLSESLQVSSFHKMYLFIKLTKLFAKELLPVLFRCNPSCAKKSTLLLLLST